MVIWRQLRAKKRQREWWLHHILLQRKEIKKQVLNLQKRCLLPIQIFQLEEKSN